VNRPDIWKAVASFRNQHVKKPHLPVDVFSIAEIEMKLDVIPFDDLYVKYRKDAAISQDFTGIYVDAAAYILWESAPEWKKNRLRFTVAHELGHVVLHREEAEKHKFKSLADFERWLKNGNGDLENDADEFAGRLLIPPERLKDCYDSFSEHAEKINPDWMSESSLRRMFASQIASKFGVNDQVIEIRLDVEEIWPSR